MAVGSESSQAANLVVPYLRPGLIKGTGRRGSRRSQPGVAARDGFPSSPAARGPLPASEAGEQERSLFPNHASPASPGDPGERLSAAHEQPPGWWIELPSGGDTFTALLRVEGAHAPHWARFLSAEAGGFSMLRGEGERPPQVFYLGRRLVVAEDDRWDLFFEQLTGLQWRESISEVPDVVLLDPPPAPAALGRAREHTRMVLANFRAEAAELAKELGDASWTQGLTPLAQLPFLIADRADLFDRTGLSRLSRSLEIHAVMVHVAAGGEIKSWWFDPAGAELSGRGGAAEAIGAFRDLAVTMGEAAGLFRARTIE